MAAEETNDADAEQLARYARQWRFAPLGKEGQRKLLQSRVLIVGCGALGSVQANTLARAGVGHLRIIDRDFLEARRRASQLDGLSITFVERAGEDGKLFGSVTKADVTERINAGDLDFELDKKAVLLEEPIKVIGVTNVTLHLHAEVEVEVEVRVEREEG